MTLSFETIELGTRLPEVIRHIDQDVIDRYAVASFDYNPIHIDPEFARKTPLGGTAFCSLAILGTLTVSTAMTGTPGNIPTWLSPPSGRP